MQYTFSGAGAGLLTVLIFRRSRGAINFGVAFGAGIGTGMAYNESAKRFFDLKKVG